MVWHSQSIGACSPIAQITLVLPPPHPLARGGASQPALHGIGKALIKYERKDGVALSGTLYTPAGYSSSRDGTLPTILWAYPREYKSKASASQGKALQVWSA